MPKRLGLICLSALLSLAHPLGPAGAAQAAGPGDLDALVAAVLEAHGGAEALRGVRALKVEGRLKAVMRRDEGTGVVYFQWPDKLLSDNHYQRSREVRVLNGSQGWINTDGTFHPAPPGAMLGMQYSLITYQLPLELSGRRDRLVYLGRVDQLGRLFEVLELSYSKALKVRVYVESETKRIAQVAGYIKVGDQTVVLSRVLGDYREVKGVLYPFHQLYHSGPTLIAEKWVEAVEVNPPLPEKKFSPE